MKALVENSRVHVPARSVGLDTSYPSAMVECEYVRTIRRMGVLRDIPGLPGEQVIDLRLIKQKLGFFIMQIGDFNTEISLLEPLHSAVSNLTRLVLMPEYVSKYRVRSLKEFKILWAKQAGVISHLVLVGHGSSQGLQFGHDIINAKQFLHVFATPEAQGQAPIIISLCCNSGNGIFGKSVSASPFCGYFIGPGGSIHVSNAALFYQSFLSQSLINGRTIQKAYQLARVFTPGVTEFNMWNKTKLTNKPSQQEVLGH